MEVVVAKRNDVVDSSSGERQPERGRREGKKECLELHFNRFHDVPALWVRARDGVSGTFWFRDLQHRAAHFALNFDGFRAGWFGSIRQGAAHIGGPSERITVLVLRGAHLGLAK